MDLKDIQNLIKFVAKSGASEVKLEMEDVKITIKTNPDESGKEQVFVCNSQCLYNNSPQLNLPTANLQPPPMTIVNISLSNRR